MHLTLLLREFVDINIIIDRSALHWFFDWGFYTVFWIHLSAFEKNMNNNSNKRIFEFHCRVINEKSRAISIYNALRIWVIVLL